MVLQVTFDDLRNTKFLNDNNIDHHPSYGPIIKLDNLNKFLFGNKDIPLTTCKLHLMNKKIIINYKKNGSLKPILYLRNDKINEYFQSIGTLEEYDNNLCLINYYKLQKLDLSKSNLYFNNELNTFWNNLKYYLKNNKSLINRKILKYIGKNFINCYNLRFNKELNLYTLNFLFDSSILNFTFGFEDINHKYYINLNNYNMKEIVNKIIYHLKILNKRDFVVQNLTLVTNNETFSEILFDSYESKKEFNIPLFLLEKLIKWKNSDSLNFYRETFVEKYPHLVKNTDDGKFVNFEGFNKYYLNLYEEYLHNFNEKEKINNLYFNITNELIKSYEELYNYLRDTNN